MHATTLTQAAAIDTLTPHRQYAAFAEMSEHKGACNAILQACRLLRASGMTEAADLLIANVERITEVQS